MNKNFFSKWALTGAAFAIGTLLATTAHAEFHSEADHYQQKCNSSCQESECCNPAPDCGTAYNPQGYFCCNDCLPCNEGFFDSLRFRTDFLWWRASEDCLTLGAEEVTGRFPNGDRKDSSRAKAFDFKFQPGFRIGLASVCPCECWDTAVNWTHFHSKATAQGYSNLSGEDLFPFNLLTAQSQAKQVVTANDKVAFISDWQLNPTVIPSTSKGKWNLQMDLVDLEFGRKFYVSSCFILRPSLGLRGARINQSVSVNAETNLAIFESGGGDLPLGFGYAYTSETKATSKFLGLGPRVCLEAEVGLPCFCNIKMFGLAAGSLIYGKTSQHAHEHFDFKQTDTGPFELVDVDFRCSSTQKRSSKAMTDYAIGLKWEHCCTWCNQTHPIVVGVSWEFHQFYDLNNFIFSQKPDGILSSNALEGEVGDLPRTITKLQPTLSKDRQGDLSTQGLTVFAEIGF